MTKAFYIFALILCFVLGGYAWKVVNTGRKHFDSEGSSARLPRSGQSILVYVDDVGITMDDLDWEYSLHTKGVFDSDDLVAIPDLGSRYEAELGSLKDRLLSGIIERKMLYKFIEQDSEFDRKDPKRFTECLQKWQDFTSQPDSSTLGDRTTQEKLKSRLCESSIISQYVRERVYPKLVVTPVEVEDYYKKHLADFKRPERVTIRHILCALEGDAKTLMSQVNRSNFAELAKKHSISPESEKGGLLGPFGIGEMPGIFDIAFQMQKGQIQGVIKSPYGFHIMMLEDKQPKKSLSLSEATQEIEKLLMRQKRDAEYQKFVEMAMDSVSIRAPQSS